MNKNIAILATLILIFLASYFLYWKGEIALKETAKNFTALAFENTESNCDNNSLTFFIENNLKKESTYQISLSANSELLEDSTVTVLAQDKKIIQPRKETLENLCSLSEKFKYEIVIKNKSKEQSIYKLISL